MKATVPFSEFSKLDLLVGTIQSAELLEQTDKLVVLEVDLGEAGLRKLVAGIARSHNVAELVGKQVVVVGNLEPRKIRGMSSEGMLLAADCEGVPVLLTTEKEVPAGTRIR